MIKRNIVHIEIPSRNLQQSGDFYHELFGWKVTPVPEFNYATWDASEGPGGGLSPVEQGARIGEILIHVNSEEIEADLKRAKALGATIERVKTEIPNTGWWGVFKDPSGNQIALYTALMPAGR